MLFRSSTSAAGKSTLMESVLALMPREEQVKYSAMTGQSLYYLGETNLKHKILAIVEEEGAEKASYALKLLQSEAAKERLGIAANDRFKRPFSLFSKSPHKAPRRSSSDSWDSDGVAKLSNGGNDSQEHSNAEMEPLANGTKAAGAKRSLERSLGSGGKLAPG